jgi:sec-independent protein translocase protein TatB
VFGLGFGELLVVLIVAVVVLGPKELPRYMRKAGQLAAQLRRIAFDMRERSGIDEILRTEGLDRDIAELRRLARGEINGVMTAVRSTVDAVRPELAATVAAASIQPPPPPVAGAPEVLPAPPRPPTESALATLQTPAGAVAQPQPTVPLFLTDHEYPPEGPDAYGSLPETSKVYGGDLPESDLAKDPVYARGEEQAAGAPAHEATP